MESRIMQVFYGNDCLPYKDSARQVHYPIVGSSFIGTNNDWNTFCEPMDMWALIGISCRIISYIHIPHSMCRGEKYSKNFIPSAI